MALIPFIVLFIMALAVAFVVGLMKYKKTFQPQPLSIALKEYGNQIKVDLENCEIKTRQYYERQDNEKLPSRIDMLDSFYKGSKDINEVKKTVSVILYKHTYPDGEVIEYRSEPLYLPEELIRYSLMNKREAVLYVDPANRNHYFFDVYLG